MTGVGFAEAAARRVAAPRLLGCAVLLWGAFSLTPLTVVQAGAVAVIATAWVLLGITLVKNPGRVSTAPRLMGCLWIGVLSANSLRVLLEPEATGWFGGVVMVVSVVLAAVAVMLYRSEMQRRTREERAADEWRLLFVEAVTIGLAWTFAVWRFAYCGDQVSGVTHSVWASLVLFFVMAATLGAMSMMLVSAPSRLGWALYASYIALAVAEAAAGQVKVLSEAGDVAQNPAWRVVCGEVATALGWLLMVYAMHLISRGRRVALNQGVDDQVRALVALGSCLSALIVGGFTLLSNGFDWTSIVLVVLFAVVFVCREYLRGRLHEKLNSSVAEAAFTDEVTKRHNRWALQRDLGEKLLPGQSFCVATFNVTQFHLINEHQGVDHGDMVLKSMADELRRKMSALGGSVYRLGGDEFAVVFAGSPFVEADVVAQMARLEIIRAGVVVVVRDVCPTWPGQVHCGVASAQASVRVDASFKCVTNALEALREAKKPGAALVQRFTEELDRKLRRKLRIEARFAPALANGKVAFWYQPIVNELNERHLGCEVLMRWHDHDEGPVGPGEVLPLAEATGLMYEVAEQSVRAAVHFAAQADEYDPNYFVAINLTVSQLADDRVLSQVAAELRDSKVAPHRLHLEVEEDILAKPNAVALAGARKLSELGCRIYLNAFGSGYSSLGDFGRLTVSGIKVDRALTCGLSDPIVAEVVRELAWVARQQNQLCVAVGVESKRTIEELRAAGVTAMQGMLFDDAMPAEALLARLQDRYAALGEAR